MVREWRFISIKLFILFRPGWADDEKEDVYFGNPFRVGIGSLSGRTSPAFILEVITRIQAIIDIDVPLHL
jgi:hypothetical protein